MTESHLWYEEVNRTLQGLADKHNLTLEQVVGIFVTFSAQKDFSINLTQTVQFLDNTPLTGMYSRKQVETAVRILNGENPLDIWGRLSQKYRNFYHSLLLRDGAVCVDTHIIRYYLNKHPYSKIHRITIEDVFKRRWAYEIIQKHIMVVSKEMGLKTYQAQAHIWVLQRGGNMW